jgi:galactofuranose transport system permease protein
MASMSATDMRAADQAGSLARVASIMQRQGALIALALLIVFGALRYDGFFSVYNITELLRYNSMFGLIALGMTFVIMTGGIDLSVGAVAALASVLAALLSPYGLLPAVVLPVLAGIAVGLFNGWVITRLTIPPFIATLAMLLAARGLALLLANNASISVDTGAGFADLGLKGVRGVPIPVIILAVAYLLGSIALN